MREAGWPQRAQLRGLWARRDALSSVENVAQATGARHSMHQRADSFRRDVANKDSFERADSVKPASPSGIAILVIVMPTIVIVMI